MNNLGDNRIVTLGEETYRVAGYLPSTNNIVLRAAHGEEATITHSEFGILIAEGHVTNPTADNNDSPLSDDERLELEFRRAVVTAAIELGRQGHSWKVRMPILRLRFESHPFLASRNGQLHSQRTIEGWISAMRRNGLEGLRSGNRRKGNRTQRFKEQFREYVLNHAERQLLRSDRQSQTAFASDVQEAYLLHCKARDVDPGNCGLKATMSVLDEIPRRDLLKARLGSAEARKRTLWSERFAAPKFLMEQVEIDCTVADVFIKLDDCLIRPWICAGVEATTGWPIGVVTSIYAPDHHLVAQTIKDFLAIRPEEFFERHEIESRFNDPRLPMRIVSDNGPENSGRLLTAIMASTGIEWFKTPPGRGEDKPHVERFFREINKELAALPGGTKSGLIGPRNRTEKAQSEAFMDYETFDGFVQRWRFDVYAHLQRKRVQSAVRIAESPAQAWARLSREQVPPFPPTKDQLQKAFMVDEGTRRVHRYGIEFERIQYFSDDIRAFLDFAGDQESVRVWSDPTDIRAIWFEAETGHCGVATAKEEGLPAISFKMLKELRKKLKPDEREHITALALNRLLKAQIEKMSEATTDGKKRAARAAKRAQEAAQKSEKRHPFIEAKNPAPGSEKASVPPANKNFEIDDK